MRVVVVVLASLLLVAASEVAAAAPVVLAPPVPGRVVAGFDAPTPFGPGHRGVDLAAVWGTPVVAPAAGTVTFAGLVVGARWVTVDHGPVRSTVGPLATVVVAVGERVRAGAPLGTAGAAHGDALLHWSARVGDRYVDPLGWTRRLVASLVPDGPRRDPWDRPVAAATGGAAGAPPGPAAWRGRVR